MLIAAALIGVYLLVVVCVLSLCRVAGRADDQSERLLYAQRINTVTPLGRRTPPDRGP